MTEKIDDRAKIEALLFAYGEPLSAQAISQALGITEAEVQEIVSCWSTELQADPRSGLSLIGHNQTYQLVTKPEYGAMIETFLKKDFTQELSPAALETLTIVLYRGPLSRSEIDYIRGVNSSFMVRSLLLRGLVERLPDPNKKHLFVYQPSFALLRFLGLVTVTALPDYESFHKKYEDLLAESRAQESELINQDVQNQPE
jgi:segregation and condensation protein B